jgi:hypothetical protein
LLVTVFNGGLVDSLGGGSGPGTSTSTSDPLEGEECLGDYLVYYEGPFGEGGGAGATRASVRDCMVRSLSSFCSVYVFVGCGTAVPGLYGFVRLCDSDVSPVVDPGCISLVLESGERILPSSVCPVRTLTGECVSVGRVEDCMLSFYSWLPHELAGCDTYDSVGGFHVCREDVDGCVWVMEYCRSGSGYARGYLSSTMYLECLVCPSSFEHGSSREINHCVSLLSALEALSEEMSSSGVPLSSSFVDLT